MKLRRKLQKLTIAKKGIAVVGIVLQTVLSLERAATALSTLSREPSKGEKISYEITEIWRKLTNRETPASRVIALNLDIEQEGELMVWHIPQVHGEPFYVPVDSLEEAWLVLDVLARYDQFQLDNNIKPDYANVSGLLVHENNEWVDWDNPETGEDVYAAR